MNPHELLRIVDSLHREKHIDPEIVFMAIESAFGSAAKRQYGEEVEAIIRIDREDGTISGTINDELLDPDEIGRIGAQTAKQVIIQKIREAERDSLIEEFREQMDDMVTGVVQRSEGGATTVALGNVEALLPRSEQIPGESHHPNERVRAVICEVRPQGSRVKVILSRTRPVLVRRLFEQEIPEIADNVITVNAISREPGHRSKVAVSSSDQRIDCVGACVGVRGNRIKNIVDELNGERIDIVRWNDDPEVLIPNSLQPAEVDQVLLCEMIGRAIVLVREDQLSLAIGRRGQNVRLASKLCGWDIEIMTSDELEEHIERAVVGFSELEGVSEDLAQRLVEQGYLSYDDLEVIEPDHLMEMGDLTAEQVDLIVAQAEARAAEAEVQAAEQRRQQRERQAAEASAAKAKSAEEAGAEETETEEPQPSEEASGETAEPADEEAGESDPDEGQTAGEPEVPEAESTEDETSAEADKAPVETDEAGSTEETDEASGETVEPAGDPAETAEEDQPTKSPDESPQEDTPPASTKET